MPAAAGARWRVDRFHLDVLFTSVSKPVQHGSSISAISASPEATSTRKYFLRLSWDGCLNRTFWGAERRKLNPGDLATSRVVASPEGITCAGPMTKRLSELYAQHTAIEGVQTI